MLNGWDLVCVASRGVANEVIAKHGVGDEPLDFTVGNFEAKFGLENWQIAPGGGGKRVYLAARVMDGAVSNGLGSLSGIHVTVAANLDDCADPASTQGKILHLTFRDLAEGQSLISSSAKKQLGDIHGEIFDQGLAATLTKNTATIFRALGTIYPQSQRDAWLEPIRFDYAYDEGDGDNAVIGAMAMVANGGDGKATIGQIPSSMFTNRQGLKLGMSLKLFTRHIAAPYLAARFGISADSFVCQDDGSAQYRGAINLRSFSEWDLDFTPVITTISIALSAGAVAVTIEGHCAIELGIVMSFTSVAGYQPCVDKGSSSIELKLLNEPSFEHSQDVPWYDYVLAGVIDPLAALLLGKIVDCLTSGIRGDIAGEVTSVSASTMVSGFVEWNRVTPPVPVATALNSSFTIDFE